MEKRTENARKIREFLRFALGISPFGPRIIDEKEWQKLYRFGRRHAILGIVFEGLNKLQLQGVELPEAVMEQGVTIAMSIEKKNKKMNRVSASLVRQLEADGFRCCLLKGQGN